MTEVEIFTDGACRGNPGPGGWAAFLRYGEHEKLVKGAEMETTNNRMELMAAIQGLKALNRPSQVSLTTDSQYVRQGITQWINGWKKRNWIKKGGGSVSNADLWQRVDKQSQQLDIIWLNGKNTKIDGDELEEAAKMAGEASRGEL